MRRFYRATAGTSFIGLVLSLSAIECDAVTLGTGCFISLLIATIFVMSCKLGGLFYEQKRNR